MTENQFKKLKYKFDKKNWIIDWKLVEQVVIKIKNENGCIKIIIMMIYEFEYYNWFVGNVKINLKES